MKISGFSFCRNADKYYYPVVESIRSALPICDEFIVAVGRGDPDDRTRALIAGIGDPKIRIIDTEWTDREKLKGWTHSQQTNIALNECTGDWCLYVQSDEVLHERDLPDLRARCEHLMDDSRVEGLYFHYLHFWGDYNHVHRSHAWYPTEIRMIRNGRGIQSFRSAQSFRRDGRKLRAVAAHAEMYHYGWVRPPGVMMRKKIEMAATHHGAAAVADQCRETPFDYGDLNRIPRFHGTHPAVMRDWIARFDWGDQLNYGRPSTVRHRHDQFKHRLLTCIEQRLLGGGIRLGAQPFRRVWGLTRGPPRAEGASRHPEA